MLGQRGLSYVVLYLFGEFGERERQIYRPRFAVVNGETPRATAPLTAGVGQLRFSDGHVPIGTAVQRVRNESAHGERVERQLRAMKCKKKKTIIIS